MDLLTALHLRSVFYPIPTKDASSFTEAEAPKQRNQTVECFPHRNQHDPFTLGFLRPDEPYTELARMSRQRHNRGQSGYSPICSLMNNLHLLI